MSANPSLPTSGNLYADLPPRAQEEFFEPLFQRTGLRVERIASDRHASPAGQWYDQPQDEWVVLLRGDAVLEFADGRRQALRPGDWVSLPAHCRHRVAHTGPDTLWLAVHAGGAASPA